MNLEHLYTDQVVVTGIGVISPLGIGRANYWQGLAEGKSAIKPVSLFDTSSLSSKLAGEIQDFNPTLILGEKGLRNLDRSTKLSLCAAKLALEDSGLQINSENANAIGVVLGTAFGSLWSLSEFDKEALRNGPKAVNPAVFPNTVINSPASQISIRFGIKGFNTTISAGFSSCIAAFEYAKKFIQLRRVSAVLVGVVEELCEQTYKGFNKTGFLSNGIDEKCCPYSEERNGAVLGEGGIVFVLETLESAKKRQAPLYAEYKGGAVVFDKKSYGKYNLNATGLKMALKKVMGIANFEAEKIDYVSTSANSTVIGDIAEANALNEIMNGKVTGSSSKSLIGETFSASSGFQVMSGLFSLNKGLIHPTINIKKLDKRCNIDCTPNEAIKKITKNVIVSTISPMGVSSAAAFSKYEE